MPEKTMSVKEFRERGYLQEINRRLLHVLGLSMEVGIRDNEEVLFIVDGREDIKGYTIPEEIIDFAFTARNHYINSELVKRGIARKRELGFTVQPLIDKPKADSA